MEHRRSAAATVTTADDIRRVTGDLPAWAPEVPDASADPRYRRGYGSLTTAAFLIGLTGNLIAAGWNPTFRGGDGQFLLSFFAVWNVGILLAYLAALGVAIWLCLQDHRHTPPPHRFITYACTFGVILLCLGPIARHLHLFRAPLEHPNPQIMSRSDTPVCPAPTVSLSMT